MRNISLLPAEIKIHRQSSKNWNSFLLISSIVVVVFVLFYIAISTFMLVPGSELTAVKQERADVQAKISNLKPYEDMLNSTNEIKKLVNEAMGDNPEWGSFLAGLFNKMPDGIWLTDFSVNYVKQTGECDIKGLAKKHDDVAEWLEDLQKTEGISDVMCQFTAKDSSASGNSNVQFEIKARIMPGEAYVPGLDGEAE